MTSIGGIGSGDWLEGSFFLILGGYILYSGIKIKTKADINKMPKEIKKTYNEILMENMGDYFNSAKSKGELPVLKTQLMLGKGEIAYLQESDSGLYEVKNVSDRFSGGGAVRVARGVYLGGSHSRTETHQEIKNIDNGDLYITNKTIIFRGHANNRIIDLDKIFEVEILSSGRNKFQIEISMSSSKTKEFFDVTNPWLWKTMIEILKTLNNNNIPFSQLQLNIHN